MKYYCMNVFDLPKPVVGSRPATHCSKCSGRLIMVFGWRNEKARDRGKPPKKSFLECVNCGKKTRLKQATFGLFDKIPKKLLKDMSQEDQKEFRLERTKKIAEVAMEYEKKIIDSCFEDMMLEGWRDGIPDWPIDQYVCRAMMHMPGGSIYLTAQTLIHEEFIDSLRSGVIWEHAKEKKDYQEDLEYEKLHKENAHPLLITMHRQYEVDEKFGSEGSEDIFHSRLGFKVWIIQEIPEVFEYCLELLTDRFIEDGYLKKRPKYGSVYLFDKTADEIVGLMSELGDELGMLVKVIPITTNGD